MSASPFKVSVFVCAFFATFSCGKSSHKKVDNSVTPQSTSEKQTDDQKAIDDRIEVAENKSKELEAALRKTRLNLSTFGSSIAELDSLATDARTKSLKMRDLIATATSKPELIKIWNDERLKTKIQALETVVNSALTKIDNLTAKVQSEYYSDPSITANPGESAGYGDILAAVVEQNVKDSLKSLDGFKDLFRAQLNDVLILTVVSAKHFSPTENEYKDLLRQLNTPALSQIRENPVVSNMEQGGRITGVARESLTGRPIPDAFVGFKLFSESNQYFKETRTNGDGYYESPFLREGAYFVDIIKEGQVELRNQNANVRLGQVTQNNVALTAPVGEGIFRIVTSWTSQVDNAVRDVDSYLSIPNSSGYINYQNMRGDGADLDRDDRDWIGPETMTIRSVQNGKYVFYVDNFSDRTNNRALGNSQIQVIVYKGSSEVRTYRVPEGAGLIYEVFNIVNGNVIDVERYNSGLKVSNNR